MIVRSVHIAFEVPGHAGAHASVYYPGDAAGVADARLTGQVAPELAGTPWPLAIVVPGINVAPDGYRWLAARLVQAGWCAVTYATIGSLGPAGQGITPGIDMAALAPDEAGTRSSAPALVPLLDRLASLDDTPIAGLIDLSRVALVGHSAGGTVALHNSRPDWIPGLRAVVGYGAHTMTATALGHGEASVVSIPAQVPVLLIGGRRDAVIDASRDRYTGAAGEHDPVGRTFAEAIGRNRNDCWLVELADANHFTLCHPVDETSGRSFLEPDLRSDDLETRALLADVIVAFLGTALDPAQVDALEAAVAGPGVTRSLRR